MRLDSYIFLKKYCDSRNKAQELIKSKKVLVDGKIVTKPSFQITSQSVCIKESNQYVSRAGKKLKNFLSSYHIDIKNKICLDIGSSSGGFIEVLLEFGAKEVIGVDVGKNQLHPKIKSSPKVVSYEECDIRNFKSEKYFHVVTCDLSFISLEHVLRDIDRLASFDIVILFKPQFEVGKDVKRDKRGVVKQKESIELALSKFEISCREFSWQLLQKTESFPKGKEGNLEIFYHFRK